MKWNPASQFRPFCDLCEQDKVSEWHEESQRWLCDECAKNVEADKRSENSDESDS